MRIEKTTPGNFVIKSSAAFVWFLSGVSTLMFLVILGLLWESAGFSIRGGAQCIFLFLLLIIIRSALGLNVPTVFAKFDKHEGSFMLKKRWIWSRQTVEKYPLAAIKNVHVSRKGQHGKDRRYYNIWIHLESGEWVPVSVMNYRFESYVRKIAHELTEFLKPEYLVE